MEAVFGVFYLPDRSRHEPSLEGNLNSDDVTSLGKEEPFTKELIETWSLLILKNKFPTSAKHQFGTTPL